MGAAMAAGLLWIVGGCSQPSDEFLDPLDMATGEQPDASTKLDGSTAMGELPCEVRDLLAKHCQSCHSDSPKGAPVALMTYAQLTAPSKADPKKTYAERSLARMQDMTRPMPPAPTATVPQAEISAFSAWVSAGRPSQKCQTMQPDDPFAKPPMCSSGKTYMGGTPKDEMNPGLACITCHKSKGKAADVTLAGTVYITGHEPDRCLGGPASGMPMATVEITDANKRVIPLAVNASGNFVYRSTMPIALPYTAVVKWNGKTREMKTPQMNGDCNSCHTQDGINGAPGRVVLP
jgi:cytochrome c553